MWYNNVKGIIKGVNKMRKLKLKKVIASTLVMAAVLALNPIEARQNG